MKRVYLFFDVLHSIRYKAFLKLLEMAINDRKVGRNKGYQADLDKPIIHHFTLGIHAFSREKVHVFLSDCYRDCDLQELKDFCSNYQMSC